MDQLMVALERQKRFGEDAAEPVVLAYSRENRREVIRAAVELRKTGRAVILKCLDQRRTP